MRDRTRRRAITAGAVLLSFTAGMEMTVTSTAAPSIAHELGGWTLFSWVFAAYTAAMTVTVPLWGKASDRLGRRVCVAASILGFAVASIGAGFAESMPVLVAWRALQGASGGAFTALGAILMAETWPLEQRPKVQGLIVAVSGTASVVGPPLGGALVHFLSWRWAFFINLPVLAISFLLLLRALPRSTTTPRGRMDLKGAAVFALFLTAFLFAMERIETLKGQPLLLAGIVVGLLVLLALFVFIERRASDPLFPLALLKIRFFTVSCLAIFLTGVVLYGGVTYLPLFAHRILDWPTIAAGHLLIPLMLAWVALSSPSSYLGVKFDFRITTLMGALGAVAGYGVFLAHSQSGSIALLYAGAAGIGICGAFCLPPLVIGTQSALPKSALGIGTSSLLFCRNVGATIGVATMGLGVAPATTTADLDALDHVFTIGLGAAAFLLLAALLLPGQPEHNPFRADTESA